MVQAGRMKIGPLPGSGAGILVKLDSGHGKTLFMFRYRFGQRDQQGRQLRNSYIKLKKPNRISESTETGADFGAREK